MLAARRRAARRPVRLDRRPRRRRVLRGRQADEARSRRARSCRALSSSACGSWRRPALRPTRPTLCARATQPVTPFHWEIEFPEVFDRENPGFDAIVGNPPFAGKNTHHRQQPRRLPRLAEDAARRRPRQRRPRRPLLPPRVRPAAQRRHLRPDRHQHHRARATRAHRPALDLQARRHDLRARERATSGRARRRSSSASSTSHKGALPGPTGWTAARCRAITAFLFHAGGHDDPAQLRGQREQELLRAASSSAWASPSTTPTRRASRTRSR